MASGASTLARWFDPSRASRLTGGQEARPRATNRRFVSDVATMASGASTLARWFDPSRASRLTGGQERPAFLRAAVG
jgi:hypothetical protein